MKGCEAAEGTEGYERGDDEPAFERAGQFEGARL